MRTSGIAIIMGFVFAPAGTVLGGGLLGDSDFNGSLDSADLRANSARQGWYESRQDDPSLLTLDRTAIGGNATAKAKLTGSRTGVAYLTQEFSPPQGQNFSAQWDIYVDSIFDTSGTPDRAGWMLIGDDIGTDPSRLGPNAEDSERFVYMSFFKNGGGAAGTMSLVARQRNDPWSTFTPVATGLNLKQWYTIKVDLDLAKDTYDVYVNGQYQATLTSRTAKSSVTHISFAQWIDGPGTFYVDNVYADSTAGDMTFSSHPVDGAIDTAQQDLMLSWPANPDTAYYYLYLSDDLDMVAASDPAARVAITTTSTVYVGGLKRSQTYYWRVNVQDKDGTISAGVIWSFRTADLLLVDDFERYLIPERGIADTWIPVGSVANLFASQTTVYAGMVSMALAYHNAAYPFAEATRTFDIPQYFTLYDGDTLSLRVRGEAGNTPQTLYVELSDTVKKMEGESVERSSRIEHPDRNVVTRTEWTEWLIPLRDFSPVNVRAVEKMTIGVGNPPMNPMYVANSVGDPAGTIYIDCIRIVNLSGAYPPIGFWGHVWNRKSWEDTGAKVPVPEATVVFEALSDKYNNEHPSPEAGEYYISVHGHAAYIVKVSATGFKQEVFDLAILPVDVNGNIDMRIAPREGATCDSFDAKVAGCGANGLDFYLKPLQ